MQRQGKEILAATKTGGYANSAGTRIDWHAAVEAAVAVKRSLPPDASLPAAGPTRYAVTRIQVVNEHSLAAARRLTETHQRILVLNFANGVHPCGGFLQGNRAQESVLC